MISANLECLSCVVCRAFCVVFCAVCCVLFVVCRVSYVVLFVLCFVLLCVVCCVSCVVCCVLLIIRKYVHICRCMYMISIFKGWSVLILNVCAHTDTHTFICVYECVCIFVYFFLVLAWHYIFILNAQGRSQLMGILSATSLAHPLGTSEA